MQWRREERKRDVAPSFEVVPGRTGDRVDAGCSLVCSPEIAWSIECICATSRTSVAAVGLALGVMHTSVQKERRSAPVTRGAVSRYPRRRGTFAKVRLRRVPFLLSERRYQGPGNLVVSEVLPPPVCQHQASARNETRRAGGLRNFSRSHRDDLSSVRDVSLSVAARLPVSSIFHSLSVPTKLPGVSISPVEATDRSEGVAVASQRAPVRQRVEAKRELQDNQKLSYGVTTEECGPCTTSSNSHGAQGVTT